MHSADSGADLSDPTADVVSVVSASAVPYRGPNFCGCLERDIYLIEAHAGAVSLICDVPHELVA